MQCTTELKLISVIFSPSPLYMRCLRVVGYTVRWFHEETADTATEECLSCVTYRHALYPIEIYLSIYLCIYVSSSDFFASTNQTVLNV